MEHGPLKHHLTRWPTMLIMLSIGVLGCFMFFNWAHIEIYKTLKTTMLGFGAMFGAFGFIAVIGHYLNGYVYYRKSKVFFDEKGVEFLVLKHGLIFELNGKAKHFTYGHEKIINRGYVRVQIEYNRKKEEKHWYYLENQ